MKEVNCNSKPEDFNYLYITECEYGGYNVKGVGTYGETSVLAGQDKIVFIETFETEEAAEQAFPMADKIHKMSQPRNTFDHLSDDDTPLGANPFMAGA